MKIKDVKCEVYLRKPPQHPDGRTPDTPPGVKELPFSILRIITDEGIEGVHFASAIGFPPRVIPELEVKLIRPELVGRDPFDREWIWQRLWELMRYEDSRKILAAVDNALWDLAGKALGLPVYKLLGAYRDKIKIYASSWRLPTPQHYYDDVAACKKRGITAYKLHVEPEIAIEACRAARQAGGDDMTLMLDPASSFNREQALKVGKIIEELNFYWFEEPVPDYDIEGLIMLREKLNVPICATQKVKMSMYSIPEYLLRGAVDIVRCDAEISGGITPCKKIADICNAFGMQCEIHYGGMANLHVACAVKNCEFYEMMWPEMRYGLKEYPELDNEGYLHVSQKPGLGVEIDWEILGKPVTSY